MDHIFGISGLIAKHLTGALSAVEQQSLDAWLKGDEKNTAIFNRIVAHESLAAALVELEQVNTELALANVKARIGALAQRKSVRLWPRIAVAAAAVAAITLGTWIYMNEVASSRKALRTDAVVMNDIAPGKNTATLTLPNGKTIKLSDAKTGVVIGDDKLAYNDGTEISGRHPELASASRPREAILLIAATPRGGTYQVELPDGTKVWLNADSKISFPSQFIGKERKILLEGEAYFEVFKDGAHPFIVQTDKQEIEVLGTHFNVNSYEDETSVRTTLLEGSVRVSTQNGSSILKPDQQAILNKHGLKVEEVNAEDVVAWKDGLFIFEDEPLESVMRKIARWYNVEVEYQGVDKTVRIGGGVSKYENVSKVLKQLELTKGVHFKIEGRKIIAMQ